MSEGVMFPITLWTQILLAGTKTPEGRAALETMCERYYPPVLAYLRWLGLDGSSAEDLAQDYFESLLKGPALREPGHVKGSFGAYVRTGLVLQVRKQTRYRTQLRRSAALTDSLDANQSILDTLEAESMFEQICGKHLLERAIAEVKAEYVDPEKPAKIKRWEVLSPMIAGRPDLHHAAEVLGVRFETAKMAFSRLQKELTEAVVRIADLASPGEAKGEIAKWIGAVEKGTLGGGSDEPPVPTST